MSPPLGGCRSLFVTGPQLLHQAGNVTVEPRREDLSITDPEHRHLGPRHRPTGGREAEELAVVCTSLHEPCSHPVALGSHELDLDPVVRERSPHRLDDLLRPLRSQRKRWRARADRLRVEEFVGDLELAFRPHLFDQTPHDLPRRLAGPGSAHRHRWCCRPVLPARNRSHLLEQADHVDVEPAVGHFEVAQPEEPRPRPFHLLATAGDAEELADVRAADLTAAEDDVALGDDVGEDEDGIRKWPAEDPVCVLQAVAPRRLPGDRVVLDVVLHDVPVKRVEVKEIRRVDVPRDDRLVRDLEWIVRRNNAIPLVRLVLDRDVLGLCHALLSLSGQAVVVCCCPTPSWLIRVSMSVWNHEATIFASATWQIAISPKSTLRPVGGMPNNSPSWVPVWRKRQATRSSSARTSSATILKSGNASRKMRAATLQPSGPGGSCGASGLTACGWKISSATLSSPSFHTAAWRVTIALFSSGVVWRPPSTSGTGGTGGGSSQPGMTPICCMSCIAPTRCQSSAMRRSGPSLAITMAAASTCLPVGGTPMNSPSWVPDSRMWPSTLSPSTIVCGSSISRSLKPPRNNSTTRLNPSRSGVLPG